MRKFDYKFVEIALSECAKEKTSPLQVCARVINSESQEGWRLKQILEPKTNIYGCDSYLVILEKEME